MKILLVAATTRDTRELTAQLEFVQKIDSNFNSYRYGNLSIDILITGIGSIFTAYHLSRALNLINYDLAINIGVSGSFDHFLELGFVVNVVQDHFADLGFEDDSNFFTLYEKELMNPDEFPFADGSLSSIGNFEIEEVEALIPVKAITVNTLLGSNSSIERIKEKYNPEIETTEGAAFMYVCLMEKIPFLQIRAVSYFVDIRKVENWNLPYAYKNLATTTLAILSELRND